MSFDIALVAFLGCRKRSIVQENENARYEIKRLSRKHISKKEYDLKSSSKRIYDKIKSEVCCIYDHNL